MYANNNPKKEIRTLLKNIKISTKDLITINLNLNLNFSLKLQIKCGLRT